MNESEWRTRKERIDTRLRALSPGWKIISYRQGLDLSSLDCHAIEEFPTANGPADYALFVGGKLLGIIEAKKVSVGPQNVLEQAKRYAHGTDAGCGNWNGCKVPFLFASNGEVIWFIDMRDEKPASRQIRNFHTPTALDALFATNQKPAHDWLLDTAPEKITRLRPYQVGAITATEAAIRAGRRELLVAMATGTGKTFLTVAQIYRLLESKLARRILFLVDRKALAAQAVRTFNAFDTPQGNKLTQEYELYSQKFQREDFGDDEPFDPQVLPNEYLTDPKPSQTFVYVCTIQRMARNLFGAEGCFAHSGGDTEAEADADKLNIPIHAFDVIIADECHRGYTAQEMSIWRETLNHFDAIKVGLLVGYEVQDTVASQKMEKYGKFDSAESYLEAFSRFVKENGEKVTALSVLLQHPKDWQPAVMEELKRTLSQNGFGAEQLQRAHRAKGFKALADVISIVKHAAAQQSPLLTAEERVNQAMDKFLTAHRLTPEQTQWLSLVREHLVKNLSMDEEDFDLTPLLNMRGGKAKARKVFGELQTIVAQLNEAVAA